MICTIMFCGTGLACPAWGHMMVAAWVKIGAATA
jgi:hypothetical protein